MYVYLCFGKWFGRVVLPMSIVLDPSLIMIALRGKNLLIWIKRNTGMYNNMYLTSTCIMHKCKVSAAFRIWSKGGGAK